LIQERIESGEAANPCLASCCPTPLMLAGSGGMKGVRPASA